MKSFSFKDENGRFYYGWWIVIAAAIITGLVYSGIVSVTGVFMLPVTEDLGLSVAAYSLYLTIMSITGIITLAISLFLTGMTLVYLLELNVLNRIVVAMGWRAGYVALAICVAIAVLVVIALVSWSPEKKGIKRIGDLEEDELARMQSAVAQGIDFRVAMKRPITWLFLISCTLAVIASSSILQHGIPTMVVNGYSPEQATGILSILSTIMIFTGPAIGVICDKLRLSVAAIGTAACFALSAVGLSLICVSKAGVWVFGGFYIFGVAAINIISPLVMSYMYGEKDMPRLIGYVNIFISIGGAIGAVGVGVLYEHYGSYQIPWLIMAAMLAAVAVIRGAATTKKRKFVPDEGEQ